MDADAAQHVHHFILYASFSANDGISQDECSEGPDFLELVYVWAPGDGTLNLPENVGLPLLGEGGYKSFRLEIHYDNPDLVSGVLDSSGVRIYYTSQLREQELGVFQIGDPDIWLYGQPVVPDCLPGDVELGRHTFTCGGACTAEAITEPVTVFREYMHMHATGVRMQNDMIRDDEVVKSAAVDFWDFDQNGNTAI